MEGYNVLFPIGFDAFGLPTENFAIKNHIHPAHRHEAEHRRTSRAQLKMLGYSFDWDREVNTTDPKYYKWTQWIFLQLFKHGLAYKTTMPVNWCTSCKVRAWPTKRSSSGVCERCGGEVVRKVKSQWMLRITEYAQTPARRSGRRRFHRARQDAAAQLDRPLHRRGGRRSRPTPTDDITVYTTRAGYAVRRDVHGHLPGAPAAREVEETASRTGTRSRPIRLPAARKERL